MTLQYIPKDTILLESDSTKLESTLSELHKMIDIIAKTRGCDRMEAAELTEANAKVFFNI